MSKTITRKYIQRITRREGDTSIRRNSGGGGGGGGVSQYWVDDNYVSKEFFNRLFEIHDENGDPILPNDVETEIDNIQAMFGFWTNAYLSALGNNPGGGGAELTLASLADVAVQGVADGQALVWNATTQKWVPGQGGGIDITAMWAALAQSGTQQIDASHLGTALTGYATETWVGNQGYITGSALNGYATESWVGSQISDMATQTWVGQNYLGLHATADAATKLATARTIWGQSFDGTGNIDGDIYVNGYYFMIGNNSENVSTIDNAGNAQPIFGYGQGRTSRNVCYTGYNVNICGGSVWNSTSGIYITSSNNIGIGTNSPSYKLHVDGTFYANGNSSIGGTLGVTGAATLSSTLGVSGLLTASGGITIPSGKTLTIGDAVLSWDSTNQGIKITKGLYSQTFISALGQGSGGESGGVTLEQVWTALGNSTTEQINISHLTTALSGYNPTSNFKTINGNSIIGTGNITIESGGGTVTAVKVGTTTYSPTDGVVSLPAYPTNADTLDGYHANYDNMPFGKIPIVTVGGFMDVGYSFEMHYDNSGSVDYSTRLYCTGDYQNSVALPSATGTLALTSQIPTQVSQLTNDSGFITSNASITGNAGSATKLQTARTIWGQSFDGTGNIDGHICVNGYYFMVGDNSENVSTIDNAGNAQPIFGYGQGRTSRKVYYTGYSVNICGGLTWNSTSGICITSSNDIGIGTDSPSYKLHVDGTFYANGNSSIGGTLGVTGATTLSSTLSVSGNTTHGGDILMNSGCRIHLVNESSGSSLYIGNSNDAGWVYMSDMCSRQGDGYWKVQSNGNSEFANVYSRGYVTALSDIRHKDIQGDVGLTVSEVANAPAVKFMWKDRRQEGLQVGSIAQYWKKVLPEAIVEAADGELTMSYGVIALMAAIKTARKVEDLERRVNLLEQENRLLKEQLKLA